MKNPGLPSDDPRQNLYNILQDGISLVWYSEDQVSDRVVLRHVLKWLNLNQNTLEVTDTGMGIAPDKSFQLITMRWSGGGGVCVRPAGPQETLQLLSIVQAQTDEKRAKARQGLAQRNMQGDGQAYPGLISDGKIHPVYEGCDVFDYINRSEVTHINSTE